jgi:hypothetical protein
LYLQHFSLGQLVKHLDLSTPSFLASLISSTKQEVIAPVGL